MKVRETTELFQINRTVNEMSNTTIRQTIHCKVDGKHFLPKRAHPSDAGADLISSISTIIQPGEIATIDTGVAVKIPFGYAGFVLNRSSQGKKGISIPHSIGLIDSDYRGNIKVLLQNNSKEVYAVEPGDRIAQLVIMPVIIADFVDLWNDTERGTGGFGSTGT